MRWLKSTSTCGITAMSRKRCWWAVAVFAGLIWVFLFVESSYLAYYPFAPQVLPR
jgi:hypothetical protein